MDHRNRALRDLPSIEDTNIIPQHIQMIEQRYNIPVTLLRTARSRNKRRLLESGTRTCPESLAHGAIPGEMSQAVEQAASRATTLGEVVRLCPVNHCLPIVVVLAGRKAVVYARELPAVGVKLLGRLDPAVSWGVLGIEDPPRRLVLQLIALCHSAGGGVNRGKEEEDVAISDGQVEDDLAVGRVIAADRVALECYTSSLVLFHLKDADSLTILRPVPADIARLSSATRHDPIPLVLFRIPGPVVLSLLQPLRVTFQRSHRKYDPLITDAAVVNDAAKGRLVPALFCLDAVGVDGVHDDVARAVIAVSPSLWR